VIFGVDVTTGREILVFGRGPLQVTAAAGMSDRLRVLRVSIDSAGDELEPLIAAREAYRDTMIIRRWTSHNPRELRMIGLAPLARPWQFTGRPMAVSNVAVDG
jgi:hypothetical protein